MKYLVAALLCLSVCLPAGAMSKKVKYLITFHVQGSDMDSPRTIFRQPIPGVEHPVVFEKVPQFSQFQIAAFHSFPAQEGEGFGVALQLDFKGKNALDLLTRTRHGEFLLTMINGVPADYVKIDAPITDGLLTVWRNVPEECVAELTKKYPPISQLKSASDGHDEIMLPTTRSEKRRSLSASKDAAKSAEKEAADPTENKPNPLERIAAPAKPLPVGQ
jgi:hypothetical protein